MAALTGTNGVITIANTTDTYTSPAGAGYGFIPVAASVFFSAAGKFILTDADSVKQLEVASGAGTSVILDNHNFAGRRPWKTPIKAATLTGGAICRLFM